MRAPVPAVETRALSKGFGEGGGRVLALDDVSVQIQPGEFFTLLGPSGCGKTTLLRLIAGFEAPSAGQIFLDGAEITRLPPYKRPVNTVFQSYALFPHLTVAENIAFGLQMQGRGKAEVAARTGAMLALVRLEALAERRVSQLSGGQQQRVALARALAPEPKVLLLDEPLSALDLKLRKEMQIELKRLQSETGISFIFVTHDQEEALTMSDRIAVMRAGRIQQLGAPQAIYQRPVNRFVAAFIGETNFLPGEVVAGAFILPGGARIAAPGQKALGARTLALRPEHVSALPKGPGDLTARLERLVYFGTDHHGHFRLEGGAALVARIDNATAAALRPGQDVALRLAPGALQVLED